MSRPSLLSRLPPLRRRASRLLALGLLLAWSGVPPAAPVPYPRSRVGLFEIPDLDFRPQGVWRVASERVRSARRQLLSRGRVAALNAPGGGSVRVAGRFILPVIPITFANVAAPYPPADYQQVLFSPAPAPSAYSVTTYYREVSRGSVRIDGQVFGWVTADSSDTYYEDGCNGVGVLQPCPHGGVRFGELLLEALAASDTGQVDWGRFDNDGPDGIPNSGDDDGVVDLVLFLQSEVDGACGTDHLWAHRYDMAAWNGGSGYVTRSPRRDATGQPIPGQFIQIRDYTLQSAVGGPLACADNGIMPIGTVAHEIGHGFGLPDLYDTNLRGPAPTQGIGEWGLMGSGNYSLPYSPSGYDAWSLAELGWVTVDTVPTSGTVTLDPVQLSDTVLSASVPNSNEYFLFANRQAYGSDTAQLNPACQFRTRLCGKAPGLLIWHIDPDQIAAHGFRRDNRVNSGPIHGVALVQADGRDDLDQPGGSNRGDPGDPWPGATGATSYGPGT
ncbi:MAG TPA: M6 family metalloprotease domain-containing protein, partial [Gemmatimonadales bacterium]|nr:M6 family metalloprotease domain-containing protein [Gemmatimonadales bacterium]